MPDASFLNQFTPGTIFNAGTFCVVFVALVKAWPAIKAKINEARRIEFEAQEGFRDDLITRVSDLEEQLRKEKLAGDKRHTECQEELRQSRQQVEGVVRAFLAYQVASARAIPLDHSPEMEHALKTLEGLINPIIKERS